MIQANELRIGNWFIGYDNKPFQFDYTDFMIIGTPAQWEQKPFEPDELIKSPIKLTEDILLKCGFDKKIQGNGSVWCGLYHSELNGAVFYSLSKFKFRYQHGAIDIELKSVHQLQNLYFDLTGQELEVKL